MYQEIMRHPRLSVHAKNNWQSSLDTYFSKYWINIEPCLFFEVLCLMSLFFFSFFLITFNRLHSLMNAKETKCHHSFRSHRENRNVMAEYNHNHC